MHRPITYISVAKATKARKAYHEYVTATLFDIRYRDSKNKIVKKFNKKQKLRVEVVFLLDRGQGTYKRINSRSYGLKLRRRKRPVSLKIILNQIERKLALKRLRGHGVIVEVDANNNLYRITYSYKESSEVKELRKKKRALLRKKEKARQRKGSNLVAQRLRKNPVFKNLAAKRKLRRT